MVEEQRRDSGPKCSPLRQNRRRTSLSRRKRLQLKVCSLPRFPFNVYRLCFSSSCCCCSRNDGHCPAHCQRQSIALPIRLQFRVQDILHECGPNHHLVGPASSRWSGAHLQGECFACHFFCCGLIVVPSCYSDRWRTRVGVRVGPMTISWLVCSWWPSSTYLQPPLRLLMHQVRKCHG